MEQSEIMRRVVGALTQAQLMREPGRDVEANARVIGQLLIEALPTVPIPAEARAEEMSALLRRELVPALERLTAAFVFAFVELAEYHDAGRTDVSSADVLREIALNAEGWPDDDN